MRAFVHVRNAASPLAVGRREKKDGEECVYCRSRMDGSFDGACAVEERNRRNVHVRKVERVDGELSNVAFPTIEAVKDPFKAGGSGRA